MIKKLLKRNNLNYYLTTTITLIFLISFKGSNAQTIDFTEVSYDDAAAQTNLNSHQDWTTTASWAADGVNNRISILKANYKAAVYTKPLKANAGDIVSFTISVRLGGDDQAFLNAENFILLALQPTSTNLSSTNATRDGVIIKSSDVATNQVFIAAQGATSFGSVNNPTISQANKGIYDVTYSITLGADGASSKISAKLENSVESSGISIATGINQVNYDALTGDTGAYFFIYTYNPFNGTDGVDYNISTISINKMIFNVSSPNISDFPLSDPTNIGNWVINGDMSDEFDQANLNEVKWHIQGKGGQYESNFRGRAPSQFSTDNVRVEDGKLKIETKWEPDYNFSPAVDNKGVAYENITTAAVISKNIFQYGYMEIRCKAANAEITSSFWTTGNKSELDMFEMFGGAKDNNAALWKKRLKFNMISWDPANYYYLPDGQGPAYTDNIQVADNVADAFHTYGFEWTADYIKIYVDGVLHPDGTILRSDLGEERWVTNVPYKIWFDSETFDWLGLPTSKEEIGGDGSVDYEIEYVRVWQPSSTLGVDDELKVQLSKSTIYPNPIKAKATIPLTISSKVAKRITVYNISGVKLLDIEKTTEPFTLPIQHLSKGIYFVSIISNSTVETKKLIIN